MSTQSKKQISKIEAYLQPRFVLECAICGEESEVERDAFDEEDLEGVSEEFYDEGWREGSSETYQCIGVFCPDCLTEPSNKITLR